MSPPPACRLQGFLPQCFEQSYLKTSSRNHLLCCCLLHSWPLCDVGTATCHWYGSTALPSSYTSKYAAAVNCCSCHNTYATQATDQAAGNAPRSAIKSFHGPCPSSALPCPCQLEQSVIGTRVQSIPSARYAMWYKSPVPSSLIIPILIGLQGVVLSLLPRRGQRTPRAQGVLRPLLSVFLLLLERCLHSTWLLRAELPPTLR